MALQKRLYYIDWLRVLAFGLLFIFHCMRFFDIHPWHIKNGESSIIITRFVEFVHGWRMPLIFLISGVGTFFAIQSKKESFVRGRVFRLIVPYVFGIILLIPPQKYFEFIFNSGYQDFEIFIGNYPEFLFNANIGWNLSWLGHIGYHIWYLPFLFALSVLLFPLLKAMKSDGKLNSWVYTITSSPKLIWLLIFPIIIVDYSLRPLFPSYLEWADFMVYLFYFLYGFAFQVNHKTIENIEKNTYLFLGVGTTIWLIYMINQANIDMVSQPEHSWTFLLISIFRNLNNFCWVLAILGLGKTFLNSGHKLLKDLNQGILPFYILHQTVIVCIGFYIVNWELSLWPKFVLILSSSFLIAIGLYQMIYRIKLLRFLFGMKKPKG